jgi:hypothetical protein
MVPMRHLLLVLAALLLASTSACLVHGSGRSTTSSSSSTLEVAPDVARGAATLGGVALFLGFMYLQSR